jgi:hypothetical protein
VYPTIWLSLALFAAGDLGQPRRIAWWAWATGVTLCAIHMALAMASVHGWSHASAVAATALATRSTFGVNWGGGVYVNYAFLAIWALETVWWGVAPDRYARRGRAVRWSLRVFYFVVILNAAVIFAVGWRRLLGGVIIVALLTSWLGTTTDNEQRSPNN